MKDATKAWFKGYWTATVLYAAAQLGIFGVCKTLPAYHEGNRVLETRHANVCTERVIEKNGRHGLSYESPTRAYAAFFPSKEMRDRTREQMAFDVRPAYCPTVLSIIDKDENAEITLEELAAWHSFGQQ
jgi:hypothetical protein